MILPKQAGGVTRTQAGNAFAAATLVAGVYLSRPKDNSGLNSCLSHCGTISNLEASVMCSDFCHCVYETSNGVLTCLYQVISDRFF